MFYFLLVQLSSASSHQSAVSFVHVWKDILALEKYLISKCKAWLSAQLLVYLIMAT